MPNGKAPKKRLKKMKTKNNVEPKTEGKQLSYAMVKTFKPQNYLPSTYRLPHAND